MQHRIRHGLSLELAREVTRRALESYQARFAEYAPEGEWLGADEARLSFQAAGRRLEGAVRVDADAVELELDVPLLFRPFQGQALRVIEAEVRSWIEKARDGSLEGD